MRKLHYSSTKSRVLQRHTALGSCVRLFALLLMALGMVACQSSKSPAASPPPALQEIWQGGPHADTFVLTEDGTNSTCARCHAPVNWYPSADDMPESCSTCKFKVEPPPPLIPEEEWDNIHCQVCHRINKQGEVEAEYIWLEIAQIEEYAEVASTTELCQKCHTEVDLPNHEPVVVDGAHADHACTDCHDAHDASATCTTTECHGDFLDASTPIPGHDEDHQEVACVACHDASDMQVGPSEDQGVWMTFLSTSPDPYTSHNIQLEAFCDRCHFPGNPWDLSEAVDTP